MLNIDEYIKKILLLPPKNLKIGDMVRIISKKELKNDSHLFPSVNEEMYQHCGKSYEIHSIERYGKKNLYRLKDCIKTNNLLSRHIFWSWNEAWLLKL